MIFSQWVTIELSWFENKYHFMFIVQEYKIILRHCCVLIFILLQLDYILLNLLQINPFYRIL